GRHGDDSLVERDVISSPAVVMKPWRRWRRASPGATRGGVDMWGSWEEEEEEEEEVVVVVMVEGVGWEGVSDPSLHTPLPWPHAGPGKASTCPLMMEAGMERLRDSVELLESFKQGRTPPGVTSAQAIIHPDTGEKIPMPFRMSGFIPFGTPVVVGLLLPNQSLASTVFWQWLNQSHNACVNYCNRNASKSTETSKFFQGYAGAVSSAVSIAVALRLLVQRAERFSPTTRLLVQRFIPFPAVASANVCNVVLMRHAELSEGISVLDDRGNVVGNSKMAAKRTFRDSPDPSGPTHANSTPPSHRHGDVGKIHVSQLEPEIAMATRCEAPEPPPPPPPGADSGDGRPSVVGPGAQSPEPRGPPREPVGVVTEEEVLSSSSVTS
ncbi:hypothetical protein CRUP_016388, partial [Coryphaenoides rupestris]